MLHVTPDIMCVVMVIFSRYTAGNFSFTSLKWRKMDCLDIFQTERAHNHIGKTKHGRKVYVLALLIGSNEEVSSNRGKE